jgi:hypothetical protein
LRTALIEAVVILVLVYLPGHFLGAGLARKGDGLAESLLLRLACCAAVATPVLLVLALLRSFETAFVLISFGVCAGLAWLILRKRERYMQAGWWDRRAAQTPAPIWMRTLSTTRGTCSGSSSRY